MSFLLFFLFLVRNNFFYKTGHAHCEVLHSCYVQVVEKSITLCTVVTSVCRNALHVMDMILDDV